MAKKAKQNESQEVVQAIKGFDADFKCREFQYEVGKTYEIEGDVSICHKGFHACDENPFDVWGFYPIVNDEGKFSRYAVTTHSGSIEREKAKDHTKLASAKITIDAEITLPDFIKRAVAWVISSTKGKDGAGDNSGDYAKIGSSGDYAKITAEGKDAVIASAGTSTRVKAVEGSWISVAEYDGTGKCIGFATGCAGKDGVPADVWLIAKRGKLVAA